MRATFAIVVTTLAAALAGSAAAAQDSYKVEPLDEAPPDALAAPIREALQPKGVRVFGSDGKPFVDLWLRASDSRRTRRRESLPTRSSTPTSTSASSSAPCGLVRKAAITRTSRSWPGTYTLRYGLQPVNGDHLGVSTYRDYLLLSMPDEDTELDPVSQEDLEFLSTGASGTTHPTVYLLLPAPEGAEAPADRQGRAERPRRRGRRDAGGRRGASPRRLQWRRN